MSLGPETSFFILGATGYIGGAVAIAFQKAFPSGVFTVYSRSASKAPALEKHGWKVLVSKGDQLQDHSLIADAVSSADVVVNAADADDLPLVKTVLAALEKSKVQLPIYIHTSGTGVVGTGTSGAFEKSAEKVWDDNSEEDIKSIAPTQPHRNVDLEIFNASTKGYSINYIIAPSTIYGVAFDNPVNKISIQVPKTIRLALEKRKAIIAGEGTNLWNNVHIADMADLYVLILEKALAERVTGAISPSSASTSPYSRFYFASVGEHAWGDISRALAPILFEKGLVDSPEAVKLPAGEVTWGATKTNSRSVSNRGFKDGWKPSRASIVDTLKEDVEGVLATDAAKAK